jgi:hypothetical protein
MGRIYLYPEARRLFPALASQTLASLERQVLARYRAARLALVWRHAVSLSTYRYPVPLPLPARMWSLARHDERWHLSVRIGDRRWSLRLRQGPGMVRQLRLLEQVAAGTVEAGEATLYEIASHRGDHRSESATDRRLMVKVAVWLAPRRDRRGGTRVPRRRPRWPSSGRCSFPLAETSRHRPIVLHSSPNRLHVLWRASGFSKEDVEALQKELARELGTDRAATSCAQITAWPPISSSRLR